MTVHWKPIVTYLSTISLLAKGWLVFVFLEDAHASLILDSLWRIGKVSLVLNRWHPSFDPLWECITKRHLWVLLPALPFSLWSRDFLEGLANTIDSFVGVEDDFQLLFDKQMARVLVEMDITRVSQPILTLIVASCLFTRNWTISTYRLDVIVVMMLAISDILVRYSSMALVHQTFQIS